MACPRAAHAAALAVIEAAADDRVASPLDEPTARGRGVVDEVPPLEQRILRVIAAAEDAGGTDDLARLHADDELAQFDRDRVTRTLVRLKDDGYVDGNLIEVDQSDLPVKAVGLRLTQRGLRAIDV